jgi:hypothetical protein
MERQVTDQWEQLHQVKLTETTKRCEIDSAKECVTLFKLSQKYQEQDNHKTP